MLGEHSTFLHASNNLYFAELLVSGLQGSLCNNEQSKEPNYNCGSELYWENTVRGGLGGSECAVMLRARMQGSGGPKDHTVLLF